MSYAAASKSWELWAVLKFTNVRIVYLTVLYLKYCTYNFDQRARN